jgi:hypothetical protein
VERNIPSRIMHYPINLSPRPTTQQNSTRKEDRGLKENPCKKAKKFRSERRDYSSIAPRLLRQKK